MNDTNQIMDQKKGTNLAPANSDQRNELGWETTIRRSQRLNVSRVLDVIGRDAMEAR